jgi:hypothetical protein
MPLLRKVFYRGIKYSDYDHGTINKRNANIPSSSQKTDDVYRVWTHPRDSCSTSMGILDPWTLGGIKLIINRNISCAEVIHINQTSYMAIESVILDVETARLVVYKDFKSMIEINEPLSLFEIHERMHTTKIPFSIIRARNVLFRQGILLSRFPELSCDLNCHRFGDSWKTTVWKRQNFEDIMRYKEPDKKAINQKKNRNHFYKKDNHNYKLKSYFEIKNRESCKGLLCRHCQKTSNAKSKNFYNKSSITNVLFIILPSLNSRLHISKLSFSNYLNWSCDKES